MALLQAMRFGYLLWFLWLKGDIVYIQFLCQDMVKVLAKGVALGIKELKYF